MGLSPSGAPQQLAPVGPGHGSYQPRAAESELGCSWRRAEECCGHNVTAMTPQPTVNRELQARSLCYALALSTAACGLVALSSWANDTRLGAPLYWAWILTGVQVLALWAAGKRRWWAWLLGAGVQPVWIVYALFTGQVGFVPGCLISAAVQLHNFLAIGRRQLSPAGS